MRHAIQMADKRAWLAERIVTTTMPLQAWSPPNLGQVDTLTVYIEGDGLSWIGPDHPSDNPTPIEPVALGMALNDPTQRAIYLARPCQFLGEVSLSISCTPKDWREGRFSSRVLVVMDEALDQIKRRHGARQIVLIGYSGGGAMAALLAAKRRDISKLVTVAGNLNHREWASHHRLTPLYASLSPSDFVTTLAGVTQVHVVGENDRNVTPDMTVAFTRLFPKGNEPTTVVVRGFDHQCCWVDHWASLFSRLMSEQIE